MAGDKKTFVALYFKFRVVLFNPLTFYHDHACCTKQPYIHRKNRCRGVVALLYASVPLFYFEAKRGAA